MNLVAFDKSSLEEIGYRQTYDIEVNHKSHNFLLDNGIIASNCYGVLSQRQIYQKYYYPLETYCAALNVEPLDDVPTIVRNMMLFAARIFDDDKNVVGNYNIMLNRPDLRRMNRNHEIAEDDRSINYGIGKIKYLSDEAWDLMSEFFTEEIRNDPKLLFTKKFEKLNKNGKTVESRIMNKKVFQALVYSGSLDYLGTRNDLINLYNELNKSNVKLIESGKHRDSLEADYCGVAFNKLDRMLDLRNLLEEKFTHNLSDFYKDEDDVGSKFLTEVLDYAEIIDRKDKKSKNGKPYSLFKVANMTGIYYPIFSWNKSLSDSLNKGDEVIAQFNKKGDFITMVKIIERIEEED